MLQSRSVLGLSPAAAIIDDSPSPESPKNITGVLMEAIRNPLHAALLVMVYFVWWTTHNVDAAQKSMQEEIAKMNTGVTALVNSENSRTETERRREMLMRSICRGVNKGVARDQCDQ